MFEQRYPGLAGPASLSAESMCCFDLATVLDRTGTLLLLTLLFDSIIRYLIPFVTIVVLTPIPHYVLHTGMFLNVLPIQPSGPGTGWLGTPGSHEGR